ncbi:hypothetical protein [Streptomyces prunicolor]|uniref:hypothetical protein n=1 Tax=Streptomyces prunicolor TaxID=67348 RepID=UPI003F4CEE94
MTKQSELRLFQPALADAPHAPAATMAWRITDWIWAGSVTSWPEPPVASAICRASRLRRRP